MWVSSKKTNYKDPPNKWSSNQIANPRWGFDRMFAYFGPFWGYQTTLHRCVATHSPSAGPMLSSFSKARSDLAQGGHVSTKKRKLSDTSSQSQELMKNTLKRMRCCQDSVRILEESIVNDDPFKIFSAEYHGVFKFFWNPLVALMAPS